MAAKFSFDCFPRSWPMIATMLLLLCLLISSGICDARVVVAFGTIGTIRRGKSSARYSKVAPSSSLSSEAIKTQSSLSVDEIKNQNGDDVALVKNVPWLIVGGGIHGVHVSARLVGSGVVGSERDICIVDNHDALLHSWKVRTQNTGMKFLRSSGGYHLDLPEDSLRLFSTNTAEGRDNTKTKKNKKQRRMKRKILQTQQTFEGEYTFSTDYERPRLDFFNYHCDSVVSKYNLDQIHTKGTVKVITPMGDEYVKVQVSKETFDGTDKLIEYRASNVVLALGNDEPVYPDWVDVDYDVIQHGLIKHLLDTDHDGSLRKQNERADNINNSKSVAIVGGGITAAHKALDLISTTHGNDDSLPAAREVHIISRHPLKVQQFDTHQEWMMDNAAAKRSEAGGGAGLPKRQVKFRDCDCYKLRRKTIAQERIPGTVTPAIHRGEGGLKYALEGDLLQWHQSEVVGKEYVIDKNNDSGGIEAQKLELTLSCGKTIKVDQVLLGTGFGKKVPGGALIENLAKELKVSEFCGYPIVNKNLRWGDSRIYVTGALAELEVGPSARNIAGARLAAERIVESLAGARPCMT